MKPKISVDRVLDWWDRVSAVEVLALQRGERHSPYWDAMQIYYIVDGLTPIHRCMNCGRTLLPPNENHIGGKCLFAAGRQAWAGDPQ